MKLSKIPSKRMLSCCLAILLLGCAVSCGDTDSKVSGQTDPQNVTETAATEDPMRAQYADIAPVTEDLGGYEFRVTIDESKKLVAGQVQWDTDEENGDTLNDAIYRRNLAVEEAYNCTITLLTTEDDNDFARACIMAGDDFTDLMIINSMSQSTDLAAEGYYLNLRSVPELSMDAPWWDDAIASLSILGKQYVTTGAITIQDDLSQLCVMFSKTLAARYDYNDLYDHVLNGTWTWELMKSLCKDIHADLDGDGEMGIYDMYGLITFDDGPYFMAVGADMNTVIYDESSETYTSNWMSDDVFTKISDYLDFAISNASVLIRNSRRVENIFGEDNDNVQNVFKEDRALFWVNSFGGSISLRDKETDFGLLPVPKWNEEQEEYCCTVTGGSAPICMPITIVNQHAAGLIADAMAYESMFTLTPAFYDVFLDVKILRDEESLAVIDLMFASKKYDFDWQLDITEIDRKISDMAEYHRNTLVKLLASKEKSAQKAIDRYIEKYEDLE